MGKVKYSFVYFNARLDLLGTRLTVNGMELMYVGDVTGFRAYTPEWQQIGFL